MNILLLNLPVHTPTVMPYSLAMMKSVLSSELKENVQVLDLNAKYHYDNFREYFDRLKRGENYFDVLSGFLKKTKEEYPKISRLVRDGKMPIGYETLMNDILGKKPDVVGISLTYNSQVFFAKVIIEGLKEKGIKVVIGGPADKSKLREGAVELASYSDFIDYIAGNGGTKKQMEGMADFILDYSGFDKKYYLTKDIIYPLRTAISCPYKRCAFCTHHGNRDYEMFDLSMIKDAIIKNKMKKICFIDDDFTVPRLKELAVLLKPLNVEWWCQLRPLKQIINLLPELCDSGLRCVAWGVESGSQEILEKIEKGTKIDDVKLVLKTAREIGIKNIAYIMFGYPGETEKDFYKTVEFLEENSDNIHLVSQSVFGLQRGSRIYEQPEQFGIKNITYKKRTILDENIFYEPITGLNTEDVKKLRKLNKRRILSVNKLPESIILCKEQALNM